MRPTAQEGTTVTTTLRAAGPRTLSAILAASAIALACVACSPGGSGAAPGVTSPTTSSDAASAPADDGASDQSDQGTTTDQSDSAGASATVLCNDLQGADLNGDSDEDTENGVAIWHQMIGDAPGDIKDAVQTVSEGLDKALVGDPTVAQSDAWGQALLDVSKWEIANCSQE
jgi:hypothetical protein